MKEFILANNISIKNREISYVDFETGEKITKNFNIKLANIHKKFKEINYTKEYNKSGKVINENIENYAMMPFAYVYYYFLAENLTVPTPQEFVDKYFSMFCVKMKNGKYIFNKKYLISKENIEFEYDDLKCRILRSYNSFNREVEFLISLLNNSDFNIEYNLANDLFKGIDLIVKYKDKTFGIAEYVSTARSKSYKEVKNEYRHDYTNFKMIDVIATFSGKERNIVKYGDVFCYNEETAKELIKTIKNAN